MPVVAARKKNSPRTGVADAVGRGQATLRRDHHADRLAARADDLGGTECDRPAAGTKGHEVVQVMLDSSG
jgi:hypothetical protein